MNSSAHEEGREPGHLIVLVKSIDLFIGADGQKLEQQLARSASIIVPVDGCGELIGETGKWRLEPDHLVVCPVGGTFGMRADPGGELSAYIVRLDLLRLHTAGDERRVLANAPLPALFRQQSKIVARPAGRAAMLCREIAQHLESADELHRMQAQLRGAELAHLLLAAERESDERGTAAALHRSKRYIDERYAEAITIERLAGIAELSPKYYVDLFKKTYGVSAFDYLTQIRMDRAKRLMLQTERRLREIANEVGYDDEFYFSRKFKKAFGLSPSAYMKKRSRRIAVYGAAALTGFLLPLGIVPYAAPLHPKWTGHYCERYGADIAVHLDAYRYNLRNEQNLDKLSRSRPDLIIVERGLEQAEQEALQRIAPVYAMPDKGDGWRGRLLALAERLDETEEAGRWIARFDRQVAARRAQMRGMTGSLRTMVVKLVKNRLYVFSRQGFGSLLYEELKLPRAYPDAALHYDHPIEPEELDRIAADCVLLLVWQESETLDYWKRLQRSVAWMSLDTVRDNRLRLIPSEPWRENSPIAMERMLDETQSLFSGYCP